MRSTDELAQILRDHDLEAQGGLTDEEREHIATTLEQAEAIPRLAYHVVALRALLALNAMQMKEAGRDTTSFEKQIADINNVLVIVQDIPEVHALLFPEEGEIIMAGKPAEG